MTNEKIIMDYIEKHAKACFHVPTMTVNRAFSPMISIERWDIFKITFLEVTDRYGKKVNLKKSLLKKIKNWLDKEEKRLIIEHNDKQMTSIEKLTKEILEFNANEVK